MHRPYLADVLENGYCILEVSHVEYWELQVDVTIVTNALCQSLPACLTLKTLLTDALKGGGV